MPLSWATIFRVVVMLVLAMHVFYMYSIARAMYGEVGTHLGVLVPAALFAMVMLLPLVWAVTLPQWPELYTRHVRSRRWFKQGRCPACGYEVAASDQRECSECGMAIAEPQPYAVTARTIRTFILVNALAWIVGCTAGELWARDDERRFRREVQAQRENNALSYTRHRRWPADGSTLVYTPSSGISASPGS